MRGLVTWTTRLSPTRHLSPIARPADVEASSRQVLPEHARPEWLTKLVLPPIEVLTGVGVNSLIVAAVVPRVTDHIACKPTRT